MYIYAKDVRIKIGVGLTISIVVIIVGIFVVGWVYNNNNKEIFAWGFSAFVTLAGEKNIWKLKCFFINRKQFKFFY